MRSVLSGFGWLLAYIGFCLLPLGLAIGQPKPSGRPFLVEFSVALGFVGLSILALQFALWRASRSLLLRSGSMHCCASTRRSPT